MASTQRGLPGVSVQRRVVKGEKDVRESVPRLNLTSEARHAQNRSLAIQLRRRVATLDHVLVSITSSLSVNMKNGFF